MGNHSKPDSGHNTHSIFFYCHIKCASCYSWYILWSIKPNHSKFRRRRKIIHDPNANEIDLNENCNYTALPSGPSTLPVIVNISIAINDVSALKGNVTSAWNVGCSTANNSASIDEIIYSSPKAQFLYSNPYNSILMKQVV